MIRAIVRTASIGCAPEAVSPDSISASVPSSTALATSEASARVGRGCVIIDSSIWVAVITILPRLLVSSMIRFCHSGTFSGPSSTPRSPRATMMPSDDVDDLAEPLERLRLLDLRDHRDRDVVDGEQPLGLDHVLGPAHERQRDVVDAVAQREPDVGPVLLGQRRAPRPRRRAG